MAAFIVATARITNAAKFDRYSEAILGVVELYGGEYVANGMPIQLSTAQSVPTEHVEIIRFPDVRSARTFLASAEYQSAKRLRKDAADVEVQLLRDSA